MNAIFRQPLLDKGVEKLDGPFSPDLRVQPDAVAFDERASKARSAQRMRVLVLSPAALPARDYFADFSSRWCFIRARIAASGYVPPVA